MRRMRKTFLSLGLLAALIHGGLLYGCGGKGTPAGPSGTAQVHLRVAGNVAGNAAAARGVAVGGAAVLVDGVEAGVTDAGGEITISLEPGTHTITVSVDGMDADAVCRAVSEAWRSDEGRLYADRG